LRQWKRNGEEYERRIGDRNLRQGLGETKRSIREVGNGGREGWEKER
jgi:hypothetical protein